MKYDNLVNEFLFQTQNKSHITPMGRQYTPCGSTVVALPLGKFSLCVLMLLA